MNKQTLQEKPHGTPYFPFESFSQTDLTGSYFAPYHWHDELEFLYITKGSLTLRTENSSYALTEGHVYFINPGIVHGIFGHSKVSHHYALLFPMSLLSFTQYDICQDELILPLLSQKLQFPYGETLPKECTEKLCSLIESAALLYDSPAPTTPLSIKILLLQILETLFLHNAFLTVSEETLFKRTSNFDPLKEVFTYIETNYMRKIHLEELSSWAHMNKNYFCKFFKKKIGKSPFTYLNEYRINQAASLLLKSNAPITEIALNTGYENMSYFIRQFKYYKHCTPSDFRHFSKHKEQSF